MALHLSASLAASEYGCWPVRLGSLAIPGRSLYSDSGDVLLGARCSRGTTGSDADARPCGPTGTGRLSVAEELQYGSDGRDANGRGGRG